MPQLVAEKVLHCASVEHERVSCLLAPMKGDGKVDVNIDAEERHLVDKDTTIALIHFDNLALE